MAAQDNKIVRFSHRILPGKYMSDCLLSFSKHNLSDSGGGEKKQKKSHAGQNVREKNSCKDEGKEKQRVSL